MAVFIESNMDHALALYFYPDSWSKRRDFKDQFLKYTTKSFLNAAKNNLNQLLDKGAALASKIGQAVKDKVGL